MSEAALYINVVYTYSSSSEIKASFRLGSKVHAISNTDTARDSSFARTTSGVLADKCEKAY